MKKMLLSYLVIASAFCGFAVAEETVTTDVIKDGHSAVDRERYEVRKLEIEIAADRDKIIDESAQIKRSRQKLKEAIKTADRASYEKIEADIKSAESVIASLKKGIAGKKDRKNELVYGKQFIPKRSEETRY